MNETTVQLPLLDQFLLNLKTQNYSEETLYNYERDLATFAAFLSDGLGSPVPFNDVSKQTINEYKAYLSSSDRLTAVRHEKGEVKISGYSLNRMLSSLRSYLRYLAEMDQKPPVSADMVKLVKTVKKHPKVAELDSLVKLIEAPLEFEKRHSIGLRNRAMMEVLFSTGMRISELV